MGFWRAVRSRAATSPTLTALGDEGRTWSYRQLAEETNLLAGGLSAHGVAVGDRVAVVARNSGRYIVALLAIEQLGAVAAPMNPRLAKAETESLLQMLGCRAVLADGPASSKLLDAHVPSAALWVGLDGDGEERWTPYEDVVAKGSPEHAVRDVDTSLCRLMFTSGTTRLPKAVMIDRTMTSWNALAIQPVLPIAAGERLLLTAPLYHVGGLDLPGLGVFLNGGTLVVQSQFDPETIANLLEEERIAGTTLVQTMLHRLRDTSDFDPARSSLKWVLFGALPPALTEDILGVLPQTRLVRGYGLTETVGGVAYCTDLRELPSDQRQTVGQPLPFIDIRLGSVDTEASVGEPGEILVRGPKVTRGYWDAPDETLRCIRDGWLHTGDVGLRDPTGNLYVVDRIKDVIRSGGENISPREVENVLYEHSAVSEASVIPMADDTWQQVPVAFVVLTANVDRTTVAAELDRHCRGRLAAFKCPKRYEFVTELPRTPSGKVQKAALRALLAQGSTR